MRWRQAWLGLVLLGLLAAAPAPARAKCVKTGKIVESGFDISSTPTAYFHLGYGTYPNFYYKYATTDPGVVAALSDAQMGNQTVEITGDAASCPASGTLRNGGTILKIERFTLK